MKGKPAWREDLLDLALGQVSESQRQELQEVVQRDPKAMLELAEQVDWFERFRGLSIEPTGRARIGVLQALERRIGPVLSWRPRVQRARWLVAGLAAAALVAGWYLPTPRATSTTMQVAGGNLRWPELTPQPLDSQRFATVVKADALVSARRGELRLRESVTSRRDALRRCGADADIELRVAALAQSIAEHLALRLDAALADIPSPRGSVVADVAIQVRALLASGYGDVSPIRRNAAPLDRVASEVARAGAWLLQGVDGWQGVDLAAASTALLDLTLVAGAPYQAGMGKLAERVAESIVSPQDLDAWSTAASPALLGELGRVLAVAPGLGADPELCNRARRLLAGHLAKRVEFAGEQQPEIYAAQQYGYADFVDLDVLDQKLAIWRRQMLTSSHWFPALQQHAWSLLPLRPGWARWMQDLRALAAYPTPPAEVDSAAMLLMLATGFAAPGVGAVMTLSGD